MRMSRHINPGVNMGVKGAYVSTPRQRVPKIGSEKKKNATTNFRAPY